MRTVLPCRELQQTLNLSYGGNRVASFVVLCEKLPLTIRCSVWEVLARTVILYRLGVPMMGVPRLGCDERGERAPVSPA